MRTLGEQMDFKISIPSDDERMRQAYRTRVPGFLACFESPEASCPVKDLSATGFAIVDDQKRFVEGRQYEVLLKIKDKVFLDELKVKAMRVLNNGLVGFNFQELDRRKQIKLDKLVLEVQKRLIAYKKAKREQEDDQAE